MHRYQLLAKFSKQPPTSLSASSLLRPPRLPIPSAIITLLRQASSASYTSPPDRGTLPHPLTLVFARKLLAVATLLSPQIESLCQLGRRVRVLVVEHPSRASREFAHRDLVSSADHVHRPSPGDVRYGRKRKSKINDLSTLRSLFLMPRTRRYLIRV